MYKEYLSSVWNVTIRSINVMLMHTSIIKCNKQIFYVRKISKILKINIFYRVKY